MTDQVILLMPTSAETSHAGIGNIGGSSLLNGFIALALSVNMASVPTSSASAMGSSGIASNAPVSTMAADSAYASSTRKRKEEQSNSGLKKLVSHTSDNKISSLSSVSDYMSTLLKRVDSFAHLQDGWDGYGGDAPDPETVHNAIIFLSDLPSIFINNLTEHSLTPTAYGTINVEWISDDNDFVSVEIGHSEIAYFYEVKGEKGESTQNIKILSRNYNGGIYSALNSLYTPEQA